MKKKVCSNCKKWKPLTMFYTYNHKRNKGTTYNHQCKKCISAKEKEKYQEKIRDNINTRDKIEADMIAVYKEKYDLGLTFKEMADCAGVSIHAFRYVMRKYNLEKPKRDTPGRAFVTEEGVNIYTEETLFLENTLIHLSKRKKVTGDEIARIIYRIFKDNEVANSGYLHRD